LNNCLMYSFWEIILINRCSCEIWIGNRKAHGPESTIGKNPEVLFWFIMQITSFPVWFNKWKDCGLNLILINSSKFVIVFGLNCIRWRAKKWFWSYWKAFRISINSRFCNKSANPTYSKKFPGICNRIIFIRLKPFMRNSFFYLKYKYTLLYVAIATIQLFSL